MKSAPGRGSPQKTGSVSRQWTPSWNREDGQEAERDHAAAAAGDRVADGGVRVDHVAPGVFAALGHTGGAAPVFTGGERVEVVGDPVERGVFEQPLPIADAGERRPFIDTW
ncbi:hypothetical protein ACWC9U_21375 [Streptomyces sp. 900116325]